MHFESSKQSAPKWGVPLFNAIATVELPAGLNKDEVVQALEDIAADVMVDVENLN
jgi:glycine cleavage system regulatory protein